MLKLTFILYLLVWAG